MSASDTPVFSEASAGVFVEKGIEMGNFELMILIAVFFMVVMVAKDALGNLFGPSSARVMSVCVGLLSAMGIHQAMGRSIAVILVPYAALAAVVFLYWLWIFQRRCFRSKREFSEERHPLEETPLGDSELNSKYRQIRHVKKSI